MGVKRMMMKNSNSKQKNDYKRKQFMVCEKDGG
jgi:hypothetical protein